MKYIKRRSEYRKNLDNTSINEMSKNFSKYNSIHTKVINEMIDSKDITPEWGQTLVGGILHRILGSVRSKVSENEMKFYSINLDKLLSRSIEKKASEKDNQIEEDIDNLKNNSEEVEKSISLEGLEKICNIISNSIINSDTDKEEIDNKLKWVLKTSKEISFDVIPDIKELYIDVDKKIKGVIELVGKKDSTQVSKNTNLPSKYKVGDIVLYKGSELKIYDINSDRISGVDNKGKKYTNINITDLEDNKGYDKLTLIKKKLEDYRKAYDELVKFCEKCDPDNKKLRQYQRSIKSRLDSVIHEDTWSDDGRNIEIENLIEQANEVCRNCELPENTHNEEIRNSLLNTFSLILEKGELSVRGETGLSTTNRGETGLSTTNREETGLSTTNREETGLSTTNTQSETNTPGIEDVEHEEVVDEKVGKKVGKEIISQIEGIKKQVSEISEKVEQKQSELNVNKEEIRDVNDKLNRVKVKEFTDEEQELIMNLLTKAKNFLLHTKPYDEIRKNQKRYYDKLESGRAINRKGYQTWTSEVNRLLVFYKNRIPLKILTLIADSLDKENISNDYVKLNKQFLGIDKRPGEKGDKKDTTHPYPVGTLDNKLGFVGVNKIEVSQNKNKIGFIMDVQSKYVKGYIIGIVVTSLGSANRFNFKFSMGRDIKWLSPYFSKSIEQKSIEPSDRRDIVNNQDLDGLTFKNSIINDIYYAQVDLSKNYITKGDVIKVNHSNLSESIEEGELKMDKFKQSLKFEEWTINKVGLLVGINDYKSAESSTNEKMLRNNKDRRGQVMDTFMSKESLEEIATYYIKFNSENESEKNENNIDLKVGDTIKYKKENGEENTTQIKEILPEGDIVTSMKNKDDGKNIIIKKETIIKDI